jgi:hypothetical protein
MSANNRKRSTIHFVLGLLLISWGVMLLLYSIGVQLPAIDIELGRVGERVEHFAEAMSERADRIADQMDERAERLSNDIDKRVEWFDGEHEGDLVHHVFPFVCFGVAWMMAIGAVAIVAFVIWRRSRANASN